MAEHDELRDLAARLAVGQVVIRYGQLLDDHRWDEFGELFTADGVWRTADVTLQGRSEIVEGLRRMQGPRPGSVKHLSFPPVIELDPPDGARAWTDFVCVLFAEGAWSVVSGGRYSDRLALDDGRWRIASRDADVQGPTERVLPAGWRPTSAS